MDLPTVKYSEERFEEIKGRVSQYLKKLGYKPDKIAFVPVSGWLGDNLLERASDHMPWYKGPTFIDVIDSIELPKKRADLPLRIPIQTAHKITGVGTVMFG